MDETTAIRLPEDPQEAQKAFRSLPFRDQLEMVLRQRGKERLQTLFLSEHPEELVTALPEQEVFFTVKEVGERDCLDLIALTTPEQFQYLLDLEFWKRDQLDPEKVLHWIEILLESGEKKVAQFLRTTDLEFIVLLLKKFLRVALWEGELTEQMDRLPPFTLDQFYFIQFKGVGAREVLEPFLRAFHRIDPDGYRRAMEALLYELESELEETGYRLRNGRLNDYGFPDFEEALEIYQYVSPESIAKEVRTPSKPIEPSRREGSFYYLTFQDEGPFFSRVLSRIDHPEELDRLKLELTSLCNKAIVAEAIDLSNLAGMERAVKKAYHYLNLGLQYLSQEEEGKATEVLRSLPLLKIFQCGVSLTLRLRRKAQTILNGSWLEGDRESLILLDPPHFETMEGLLRKRPSFYRNGIHDDFRDLRDLSAMEQFLESIEAVLSFFKGTLPITPRSLKTMDLSGCLPERWEEITLSTILLTALANQILQARFQFEPVERGRLGELLAYLFERDAGGEGILKGEVRHGLVHFLQSVNPNPQEGPHLADFLDFSLNLLQEGFGKIPAGEEIDPRFVKGLLIRL
ncbi:MAG: DUF6178 family protein [Desulfobacterota bacterium]|nr:DUF6178 family protein [Thermodesulfobacteriota bacterium]